LAAAGAVGKIAFAHALHPTASLGRLMTVPPLRIAHRGMPRLAPENTLPSFAAALAAGADGIELDVHATADGVVVVHHDAELSGGTVIARTGWRELQRAASARDTPLPTLAEVCDLVEDRVELFVEIKGSGIEREVIAALAGHRGPSAIHSFDHEMIGRLSRLDRRLRLGLLFEHRSPNVGAMLAEYGATDAWPHHSLVDGALVDAVHHARGRVIPWTVNDQRDIARLTALEVDGLCTDDVSLIAVTTH
jgi:glycerophosphoryl diester phosphodiesterase